MNTTVYALFFYCTKSSWHQCIKTYYWRNIYFKQLFNK